MKLYNFFRSGTSFRVRIALHLKGLPFDYLPVALPKGEHKQDAYRAISPDTLVPVLDVLGDPDQALLSQSMAIIEYLDETHPQPALLPADAAGRARVRAIALTLACDIHPLNNLRVLKYLKHDLKVDEEAKNGWYRHWIDVGLGGLEQMLAGSPQTGRFCHGDTPTLADVYLIPQVESARRFNVDMARWPLISAIDQACGELHAFQQAAPNMQPDA